MTISLDNAIKVLFSCYDLFYLVSPWLHSSMLRKSSLTSEKENVERSHIIHMDSGQLKLLTKWLFLLNSFDIMWLKRSFKISKALLRISIKLLSLKCVQYLSDLSQNRSGEMCCFWFWRLNLYKNTRSAWERVWRMSLNSCWNCCWGFSLLVTNIFLPLCKP